MKKNILYTILYIFIGLAVFSCQQDDEYTLKEYNPKGGFTDADFSLTSSKYLETSKEEIKLALEFSRLKGQIANFDIAITSVEPATANGVFILNTASGSMTTNKDTISVGEVDWSVLSSGEEAKVTISLSNADKTTEFGTNTESVTISLKKADAPILELGNLTLDKYFDLNTIEDLSTTIEIPNAINKPAEQEIRIPLGHSFNETVTEGTHFDIQQELVIPVGSTSASITLDVYNTAFAANERADVYVEAYQDSVPANIALTVGKNYWIGANIGKKGDIIRIEKDSVYIAEINYVSGATHLPTTVTLEVSDVPVFKDLLIPFTLNEYNVQNGVHILMDNLFIKVKAGSTTGTIDFEALPEAYTFGTAKRLWVNLKTDDTSNPGVIYDATDWWTAIDITIVAEIWTVNLDQSASYDVLISDVSTTVDVDVVIPNVLDKAAPSDLEIPVRLNEYNVQAGTHFNTDGIIRVNSGETSGTIRISVIGSAFAAGENKSLWIEVYDEDMPTNPILFRNTTNWWTTLKVGKN